MKRERSCEGGGLRSSKDRLNTSRSSVWRRQEVALGAVATEDVVGESKAHKPKAVSCLCAVETAIIELLVRFVYKKYAVHYKDDQIIKATTVDVCFSRSQAIKLVRDPSPW